MFLRCLSETEFSLQSRAHFVDLIVQKWCETVSFLRFVSEIELSLQSRVHFVDHFPGSSRATAETETLQRRPATATLPEKTQGFAPESVFKREFTRSRSLALLNYFMMM